MAASKIFDSFERAVADIPDGATIMVGGAQGPRGIPQNLILALRNRGTKGLTLIAAGGGFGFKPPADHAYPQGFFDMGILVENRQVKKLISAVPYLVGRDTPVTRIMESGEVEIELSTHGTVAARIWAGGAGIGGIYTPTGVGTVVEQGKEKKFIDGREYVLELPLKADFALIWAYKADKMGNLVYRGTGRNFNPVMARAAKVTVAEVQEVVEPGELDPEAIITPGIFVHRIVEIPKGKK